MLHKLDSYAKINHEKFKIKANVYKAFINLPREKYNNYSLQLHNKMLTMLWFKKYLQQQQQQQQLKPLSRNIQQKKQQHIISGNLADGGELKVMQSKSQKTLKLEDDIKIIFSAFDVVTN